MPIFGRFRWQLGWPRLIPMIGWYICRLSKPNKNLMELSSIYPTKNSDGFTFPETHSKRRSKINGWKGRSFPFGCQGLFSEAFAVSFREGKFSLLEFVENFVFLSSLRSN